MEKKKMKDIVEEAVAKNNGILYLKPCWVARDFLPAGKRLGLKEEEYEVGERGYISERWLGSETKAENRVGPEDEGLSYIEIEGHDILLKDAVSLSPETIMGNDYSKIHQGLGRLPKIFDYDDRLFYHVHQMEDDAHKVNMNPKEEAYYFPEGLDMGPHPETFFGVHPYIVNQKKQNETLLPHLVEWNSDKILKYSRAYLLVPGEGFHLPAGALHAPGTALTIELQESSDVMSVFQAKIGNISFSKDMLFRHIPKEKISKIGEKAALDLIDWQLCGDPYFYENRHTEPILVKETQNESGFEEWIFYNTKKFSGKKLTVKPGKKYVSKDNGVYNFLVWQGGGKIENKPFEAFNFGIDEALVTHQKAVQGVSIENTGTNDLILYKFFGPDINIDIPYIPKYPN